MVTCSMSAIIFLNNSELFLPKKKEMSCLIYFKNILLENSSLNFERKCSSYQSIKTKSTILTGLVNNPGSEKMIYIKQLESIFKNIKYKGK